MAGVPRFPEGSGPLAAVSQAAGNAAESGFAEGFLGLSAGQQAGSKFGRVRVVQGGQLGWPPM
jgi:hypothetical protein